MHRFSHLPISLALIAATPALAHDDDLEALPVGDGRVTDFPEVGHVFACQLEFRTGGARHSGPWFHGETWNPLEKPHVRGHVMWPEASFALTETDNALSVESNGLPVSQPTGIFPISPDDPAYVFDTNPNPIKAQSLAFSIPLDPVMAVEPGCLPMGMIGVTLTGVAFYNALDDAGLDAAAHEVQDLCNGHPQGKGQYHYHSSSPCLPGADSNDVVGWALDGYPILGMREEDGRLITNAELDACHGRAEQVDVGGRSYDYAYRLTREYPYVMGCFSGRVLDETRQSIRQSMGPPRPRGANRRPPARPAVGHE
ncbi:MAG: YHYH protein [Geminicoccaceae bacterium]